MVLSAQCQRKTSEVLTSEKGHLACGFTLTFGVAFDSHLLTLSERLKSFGLREALFRPVKQSEWNEVAELEAEACLQAKEKKFDVAAKIQGAANELKESFNEQKKIFELVWSCYREAKSALEYRMKIKECACCKDWQEAIDDLTKILAVHLEDLEIGSKPKEVVVLKRKA